MPSKVGLLLLITLFLSGCGAGSVRDTGIFEPYVAVFESEAKSVGKNIKVQNISIQFGDLTSTQYGTCTMATGQVPTITINAQKWNNELTEERKQALIDHELGHCVLLRVHNNTYVDLRPASIMNQYLLTGDLFNTYNGDYVQELFSGS